ncbi:MAG: transposase family protein [Methylococcales bacterium]|nr:transposase family protein [Methylococcales bacterium]
MVELEGEDPAAFKNFIRMEPAMFHEILNRVGPRFTKKFTWFRRPLHAGLRLAITLRYMATGNSYHSLMYSFRVPHNTISRIVREVTAAIMADFSDELIRTPTTPDEWRQVAETFSTRWQFHNCLGALDGKHVAIRRPKDSGSLFFNYKKFFSIVLLALVDGDCKFLWADVGANGSASDSQVFGDCELREAIESGEIGFPDPQPLPNDNQDTPFFIIGDDAFGLKTWMMKPYGRRGLPVAERVFNYRLSRARRIVENAFGILANRFRCLLSPFQQRTETVEVIVIACMCMHNLMRVRYPTLQNAQLDREDANGNLVPGEWRQHANMQDVRNVRGGNLASNAGKRQRELLKLYYNSPAGAVSWQLDQI